MNSPRDALRRAPSFIFATWRWLWGQRRADLAALIDGITDENRHDEIAWGRARGLEADAAQ